MGLDGVQDVEPLADLPSPETGCEAPQDGKLGRTGLLDDVMGSGIRSGGGEVPLDGGCDRC